MNEMNELYGSILIYAARLLSDSESAKDITQEVFLRLEQNKDRVQNGSVQNVKAFAYKTARNLIIDCFRKTKMETLTEDLPADKTLFNPAILAEKKEQKKMLEEKFNELAPRHREVLRLKFQEGLKYAEIAEILGEPVTTIAWLIHEAVAKLRSELTKNNN
ncbi:DNA-directed RNA polymerase sigma-70 factor [Planctomycetales bacterium]|nr:DNA-directed RNA polymerase sigma-70 factor [Planctomycetales bacterium]